MEHVPTSNKDAVARVEPMQCDQVLNSDQLVNSEITHKQPSTPPEVVGKDVLVSTKKANSVNFKVLKEKAQADYAALTSDKQRHNRLHFLLERSAIYSKFLSDKLERQKQEQLVSYEKQQERKSRVGTNNSTPTLSSNYSLRKKNPPAAAAAIVKKPAESSKKPLKRKAMEDETSDPSAEQDVANSASEDCESLQQDVSLSITSQPKLFTGGTMRDYQIAGMEWLASLYENGLNGILADEMGLGKTIQTIAFFAYLREREVFGPYLIVAPLSTLANWINEFERFTPKIPVLLYHGNVDERMHIRNKRLIPKKQNNPDFPVVVTSYELVMNDRKYLQKISWKYIVVDEGHRIKNLNCKLIRELKSYRSANRLLLTGTPLQNNLAELWSLLNFLLPDIFDDLDSFQQWFDFSDLNEKNGQDRLLDEESTSNVVTKLHKILQPFLLRRIKADVEKSLPLKREYILYAQLSKMQIDLYNAIIGRNLQGFLTSKRLAEIQNGDCEIELTEETHTRKRAKVNYVETSEEEEDDIFIEGLAKKFEIETETAPKRNMEDKIVQSIKGMRLQNAIMQLRKVCSHPYLFEDMETLKKPEQIVALSGKMQILENLLDALLEKKHRVLIFSQMTSMLDIIQTWLEQVKHYAYYRIDGHTKQEQRCQFIYEFNQANSQISIFLLSTRAGGLGINLASADTVIFYDSDWNPQMDLQAQDRVHRIGQVKPVIIYRLVTAHTIENKILERATAKRKLEKIVIHKGRFKDVSSKTVTLDSKELLEIIAEAEEYEQIYTEEKTILAKDVLERIMDRSETAYSQPVALDSRLVEQVKDSVDRKNNMFNTASAPLKTEQ